MKEVTEKNFGLVIAFMLPGFLLLWALTFSYPNVAMWLKTPKEPEAASVGAFLHAALASLAIGLLLSAIRYIVVDKLLERFHRTLPKLDIKKLIQADKAVAFQALVENFYRYYQYYSNTFVAVFLGYAFYLTANYHSLSTKEIIVQTGFVIVVCVLLLAASNDTFVKYRRGSHDLISEQGGTG
jgi:hypothetical protein